MVGGLDEADAESGEPAPRQELRLGETFHAGQADLRLEPAAPDSPTAPAPAAEDDTLGLAEDLPAEEAAPPAEQRPAPSGEARVVKRLVVIDGADQGRYFPLPDSGTVSIGKDQKSADIILHDLYVSRVHCELRVEGDKVVVNHLSGPNGTLINGQKITEQAMQVGEVLRVGNSHLRLELAVVEEEEAAEEEGEEDVDFEGDVEILEDEEEGEIEAEVVEEEMGTGAVEAASKSGETYSLPHEPVDRLLALEDQALGHYRIGPLLGRGHSGLVFRAQDQRNNQVVALKVLSPDFPANDAELQRFIKAMKAVTQVQHPHLITPHGAGKNAGFCWIAREFVEGESLARLIQRLQAGGKPDWTRACRVAVHVGKALDYLHKYKLTHGNITPRNILVRQADKATKLADLLLNRCLEGSRLQKTIQEKKLLAELPFVAPDPNPFASPLADLYSLGAVLYALLTGQPPFRGESAREILTQVREGKVVKPSKIQSGIPGEFEAAVLLMMARRPEDRFPTVAEMLAAVEPIAAKHEVKV